MATTRRKKSRNRSGYNHSSRNGKKQKIASLKPRKSKKNDFDFFPFLFLVGIVIAGVYFFQNQKVKAPKAKNPSAITLDQPSRAFTIDEKIERKKASLKLKQDIGSHEALSEQFKKPVENIDTLEPNVSSVDMGVSFSDDPSLKSVLQDLDEKPFENDIYKDPEEIIRRQIAHKDWLREHLEKRNKQEKKEFIDNFVRTAREQGYKVHFTGDMQVILEPIEPEESASAKKDEEEEDDDDDDLEEVNIQWK